VVVFTSLASTSLKYNCSLTRNKTFFMYFVGSLLTSIDLNKHERLTHIFTLYILIFLYPKGCSIISLGYENVHWPSTTHISISTKYIRA
jgi:hypothetical protein